MNLPDKIYLRVNRETAKGAKFMDTFDCPIARQLKKMGFTKVWVGQSFVKLGAIKQRYVFVNNGTYDKIIPLIDGTKKEGRFTLVKA